MILCLVVSPKSRTVSKEALGNYPRPYHRLLTGGYGNVAKQLEHQVGAWIGQRLFVGLFLCFIHVLVKAWRLGAEPPKHAGVLGAFA